MTTERVAPGIRRRDNGTYQVRVSYTDAAGKVRTVSATADTITDAKKKQRELKASADRGQLVGTSRQTVKAWLERWLSDCESAGLAPYTLKSYRGHVERYIVPALGGLEIGTLNAEHVRAMMTDLQTRPHSRTGKPLSDRTRLHTYRVLHTALEAAVDAELIPTNPARKKRAKVRKVKAAKRVQVLTAAESNTLREAARVGESDQLYAVVLLALTLGLRRGEILGLRWSDLDLATGTAHVEQSAVSAGGGITLKAPKTEGSRRTLTMPGSTARELAEYRKRQLERRLAAGSLWQDHGLVIDNGFGRPWNPDTVSGAVTALARGLGYTITLHGLRHTFASLHAAAGTPITDIAAMLGHSSAVLALTTYIHWLPDAHKHAADRLDAVLRAAQ